MERNYMLFTESEMQGYSKILIDYLKAGLNIAWPVLLAVGGIILFIVIVRLIIKHMS